MQLYQVQGWSVTHPKIIRSILVLKKTYLNDLLVAYIFLNSSIYHPRKKKIQFQFGKFSVSIWDHIIPKIWKARKTIVGNKDSYFPHHFRKHLMFFASTCQPFWTFKCNLWNENEAVCWTLGGYFVTFV